MNKILFFIIILLTFPLLGFTQPKEKDFQLVPLVKNLRNPMSLKVAPDGRVFFTQRFGDLRIYLPSKGKMINAARIRVYFDRDAKKSREDGLLGFAFDPNFTTNQQIYLYYSPTRPAVDRVSRFTMRGNALDMRSEVVVLEIPRNREHCCHNGGSLTFDGAGNLYISTGDNSKSRNLNALDEKKKMYSAEKSSSNSRDLRGKILRITPQANGKYSIPPGNLFPKGKRGLKEVYVMGIRNAFKIFVDPKSKLLYWVDIGGEDNRDTDAGPRSYDEINRTDKAGNFGWPYFVADNKPYRSVITGKLFNPKSPENLSIWNKGTKRLPPAQPSLISKMHGAHMTRLIYYFNPKHKNPKRLPSYFDNHLFYWNFNNSALYTLRLDNQGKVLSDKRILRKLFSIKAGLIDMALGPDHQLYLLQYGSGCCPTKTYKGQLSRLDYRGNHR